MLIENYKSIINLSNNKATIYKLISPSKKCYIGQTVNLKRRLQNYACLNCKKQFQLYNAIKKYGFNNFKLEIIEIFDIKNKGYIKRFIEYI